MQMVSIDCELGKTLLQRVFPPNGSQFYACRAPPSVAEGGGAPWFGRPHKSSTRTKKRWCLVCCYLFEPQAYYTSYSVNCQAILSNFINYGIVDNIFRGVVVTFYEKYVALCNKNGKSPSGAALEMGLSKPSVNRWKKGGGITDATILKVANYFNVPVDELTEEPTTFYNNYVRLCAGQNLTPSAAAVAMGFKKSNVTYWKNGRNPSDISLVKIANYFGVSVDALASDDPIALPEQKESAPDPKTEGEKYTVEMWEKQAEQWSDEELNQAVWKLLKIQERRQKNGN